MNFEEFKRINLEEGLSEEAISGIWNKAPETLFGEINMVERDVRTCTRIFITLREHSDKMVAHYTNCGVCRWDRVKTSFIQVCPVGKEFISLLKKTVSDYSQKEQR